MWGTFYRRGVKVPSGTASCLGMRPKRSCPYGGAKMLMISAIGSIRTIEQVIIASDFINYLDPYHSF